MLNNIRQKCKNILYEFICEPSYLQGVGAIIGITAAIVGAVFSTPLVLSSTTLSVFSRLMLSKVSGYGLSGMVIGKVSDMIINSCDHTYGKGSDKYWQNKIVKIKDKVLDR